MIIEPVINKNICLEREKKEIQTKKLDYHSEPKRERIFKEIGDKDTKIQTSFKFNSYTIATIIFLFGIVIGSIVFTTMIEDESTRNMIIEKFSYIDVENKEILLQKSFYRNMKLLITYWLIGISVVGAPVLILLCLYKGFSTAFVISSILMKYGMVEGNIYVFKNLFLYYIFLILGIILLTASSLKVSLNVLKNKKDIRYELIRHSLFTIIAFFLFLVSIMIEVKSF